MRILDSARKHGVTDEQIMAALQVPYRQYRQGVDRLLVIGADHSSQLLELVVVDPESDDPCVIHAMKMRKKFQSLL
ncbi:hypothetical protein [Promicromonospora sp. NPDC057488]|uniref:hypothetical protein n=1 Tax=Promicromonospora sp. NPDC057488 TaxID=3346147 RepID=UPI00366ED081